MFPDDAPIWVEIAIYFLYSVMLFSSAYMLTDIIFKTFLPNSNVVIAAAAAKRFKKLPLGSLDKASEYNYSLKAYGDPTRISTPYSAFLQSYRFSFYGNEEFIKILRGDPQKVRYFAYSATEESLSYDITVEDLVKRWVLEISSLYLKAEKYGDSRLVTVTVENKDPSNIILSIFCIYGDEFTAVIKFRLYQAPRENKHEIEKMFFSPVDYKYDEQGLAISYKNGEMKEAVGFSAAPQYGGEHIISEEYDVNNPNFIITHYMKGSDKSFISYEWLDITRRNYRMKNYSTSSGHYRESRYRIDTSISASFSNEGELKKVEAVKLQNELSTKIDKAIDDIALRYASSSESTEIVYSKTLQSEIDNITYSEMEKLKRSYTF